MCRCTQQPSVEQRQVNQAMTGRQRCSTAEGPFRDCTYARCNGSKEQRLHALYKEHATCVTSPSGLSSVSGARRLVGAGHLDSSLGQLGQLP
jgi:hypothetical protein